MRFAQGITVPLIKEGPHHVVEATVKNAKVRLLLDTGASITTLTPTAAQRLDIRYDQAQSITLATAGGLVSAPLIDVRSLRLEMPVWNVCRWVFCRCRAVIPLTALLGMNFLQQFASSIDQQEGVLRLGEKS